MAIFSYIMQEIEIEITKKCLKEYIFSPFDWIFFSLTIYFFDIIEKYGSSGSL